MEESAHFANATERNSRNNERRGCEKRENEPTPDCWRRGGWEHAGMGRSSLGAGALIPARGPTCQILIIIQLPMCRSTKTQVDPSSALKRSKHHQSDPSNVRGILSSS